MNISYCLPIIKTKQTAVMDLIEKNRQKYRYFEVWLDSIEDLDDTFIKQVLNTVPERLIILFHRGTMIKSKLTKEEKSHLLSLLDNTAVLLDLDVSEIEELEYITKKNLQLKLITSYHNYQATPSNVELKQIISRMEQYNPEIYKIATQCVTEQDALRLLELALNLREHKKRHIVLGMGEFGTITRVYGTLWGNELIYAPQTATEASAPGQRTKQELENIFRLLNTKN